MRCLCLRSWTLHYLIAITLLSLSVAQITQQQFEASFKLYPATGPGGCDRDAPNGTPMLNYVLQSIDDAWTMASTAMGEMQLYFSGYSGRRTRPLLFLFFGVKFTEYYNFEPDGTSENTYNYVLSTLQIRPLNKALLLIIAYGPVQLSSKILANYKQLLILTALCSYLDFDV